MRQDAGAISSFSAEVQSGTSKAISKTKALGAASAIAGKLLVLGIGGAMAVSAKAAIDFESSMAGVAKTTDLAGNSFDKNSGPLFQFGEALRSLALRIPINVNDLAAIAALGGQLGIETPNLVKFTEVMAALGVSTNLSAEEAATGFARFANIMRTPQDEFDRLGSIVVELGNNLATTEGEILKFGTRIAPVGRIVGATEEEVFGLAGALTSLGVPAERGGTAIQKWFIQAKTAVDGGGDSLRDFAKVAGMTAEDFSKMFKEAPSRAFAAFVQGLDDINTSGGNVFQTLENLQLSEVRTTQVLLAAAGGVDVLTNSLDLAQAEGEEVNALFIESARRYGTTESAIKLVSNAFTDLRIEIGNMILGTGGLAFSIDVLREFFGIIKDNLGVLGSFAKVAAVLVAMKLGLSLFQSFSKASAAAKAMYSLSSAATAVSTSSRLMQGSMMLVTAGMQGLLGIAGALATVWAIQAVNAATLRAEVKGLVDEVNDGADAFEVLNNTVEDTLTNDQVDLLNNLGQSTEDLTRWLMEGKPAASEFGRALEDALLVPEIDEILAIPGIDSGDMPKLIEGIDKAEEKVSGFLDEKHTQLRNDLIESGQAVEMTDAQLEAATNQAIKLFGYDVSGSQFVNSVRAFMSDMDSGGRRGRGDPFGGIATGLATELDKVDLLWTDFLPPEDKENIVEDFMDGNTDAVVEFRKAMETEFNRISDTVREGMPVWGDYEQAVLGATDEAGNTITASVADALAAQDLFLEDTRDWITRMPDIMDMGASADTVGWIESLENPIRGAIGRLNDVQLQELIDGANANFDELNKLHLERWMQLYPDAANVAFGAMVGELGTRVEEMNLPGQEAGEAFRQGLLEIMQQLPEEDRASFLTYVSDLLKNDTWMAEQGFSSGDSWIAGLIAALAGLAGKAGIVLAWQIGLIKDQIDDAFGVKSPSKWFKKRGEYMVQGLEEGLAGLGKVSTLLTQAALLPTMGAGSGAMTSVSNSRTSTYNLTVNAGGNGRNIRSESQTLLTLLTIVGGVEAGAGR